MILILTLILALFVLPMPWALLVVVLGVIGEVGEIVWGRRLARRWRPRTGAEAMVGREAEVVAPCHPNGTVRIQGELWNARADAGADPGDTVRVEAVEDLTLVVVRV